MHFFKIIMLAGSMITQWLPVGDSNVYGIGTTGYGPSGSNIQGTNSYPEQAYRLLNTSRVVLFKRGYPGYSAADYVANGKQAIDLALTDPIKYRFFIVSIDFGSNDITRSGVTATDIFNNIKAVHTAYRARGYKTITVTVMNRKDGGKQVDALRQQVNALIRANWQSYADDICDLALQPLLDDVDAPDNTLVFRANDVDGLSGVHLTDYGATLKAAEIIKPVKRLMNLR